MNPADLQPFLDVAISVLETQDVSATAKLKDFLMSSPGPAYIEQSLGFAAVYFAENKPVVFDWILNNQDILSPELELDAFTRKMVRQRLLHHGWSDGEDFVLDSEKLLVASVKPMTRLESCFSNGELTLIKASLAIESLLVP